MPKTSTRQLKRGTRRCIPHKRLFRIDVAQQIGILEKGRAYEVFARQIVFREAQGVFIERDQEAIVGHYTRRGIAVHRPHEGIAIKARMFAKRLVRHVETQVIKVELREHRDSARIAFRKRVNLPEERDEVAKTLELVGRKSRVRPCRLARKGPA